MAQREVQFPNLELIGISQPKADNAVPHIVVVMDDSETGHTYTLRYAENGSLEAFRGGDVISLSHFVSKLFGIPQTVNTQWSRTIASQEKQQHCGDVRLLKPTLAIAE